MYKLEWPLGDWHSWRQADTASVARSFYQEGFNPLMPKYDDMNAYSEEQIYNPKRHRFVEFPIYNSLIYFAYVLNGGVDERYARLISILFSLGSTIFVFLLAKKYFNTGSGLFSAFVFSVLPFNVFFSRVILPEPTLIFFGLGALYFTDRWIWENKWSLFVVSLLFASSALLVKPMAIFFLLPLVYSVLKKEIGFFKDGSFKSIMHSIMVAKGIYKKGGIVLKNVWFNPVRFVIFIVLAAAPIVAWRIWITNFPEGIPASEWLFNGNGIRFKPSFWYWIFVERLGKEILFTTGVALFFIGLIFKPENKNNGLLHFLALSMFVYICVFATGNVQHDYYQAITVPILSIFMGRALYILFTGIPGVISRVYSIPLAIFLLVISLGMTWWYTKDFWQIIDERVHIVGHQVDKILPKDAQVVAPAGGDTTFLYHINRPGFAVMAFPLNHLRDDFGIDYYVALNYDEDANNAMKRYEVVQKNKDFIIFDLHKEVPSQ